MDGENALINEMRVDQPLPQELRTPLSHRQDWAATIQQRIAPQSNEILLSSRKDTNTIDSQQIHNENEGTTYGYRHLPKKKKTLSLPARQTVKKKLFTRWKWSNDMFQKPWLCYGVFWVTTLDSMFSDHTALQGIDPAKRKFIHKDPKQNTATHYIKKKKKTGEMPHLPRRFSGYVRGGDVSEPRNLNEWHFR